MIVQKISGFDNYHIIPRNKEKFVSLSMTKYDPLPLKSKKGEISKKKGKNNQDERDITLIFKDSLSFLCGTLDKNTELLVRSNHKFPYLSKSKLLEGKTDEKKKELLKLLCRKGKFQ